jgi:hypothetical protein
MTRRLKSSRNARGLGVLDAANPLEVTKMHIPLGATNSRTTERLLELALAMLDDARREQDNIQLPANNWLTNNFTLEIIRAKVAANKG